MKKRIALLFVVVLTLLSVLTACGEKKQDKQDIYAAINSEKDFRNVNLRCTADEVIASEEFELSKGDPDKEEWMLFYKDVELDGSNVTIAYISSGGVFQEGAIIYCPEDAETFFEGLKARMLQIHGPGYISYGTNLLHWEIDDKCYEISLMDKGRVAYLVMTKEYSDMIENHE